jgi:Fe-S-cluster-containing hydrogenase component 2
VTDLYNPLRSLKQGHWFKLICGASFQHLPAVRSLTLAYTLAGADCIDVAADPAVISAAQAALTVAKNLTADAQTRGFGYEGKSPFLMVSLNDGEDPHFRKAEFNSSECPSDCLQPCERICPTQAIVFQRASDNFSGVVSESCYGCGRCIPICPVDIIHTRSYVSTPGAIAPLVLSAGIDAVEIHTKVGRLTEFERLWKAISPWVGKLKVVAVSCPDGEGLIDYLRDIYNLISPLPCALIWQTDGRPMSGDIGDGTTNSAVKLGQKVLTAKLPGYVQLAGGTNSYTVPKLRAMGLLTRDWGQTTGDGVLDTQSLIPMPLIPTPSGSGGPSLPQSHISGVAYGSYARVLLSRVFQELEQMEVSQPSVINNINLEEKPDLLWQAVELANSLVSQLKSPHMRLKRAIRYPDKTSL